MTDYDVLIVGCGPVGATLANILRLKGYSVAIFDRDHDVFVAPRAMQLDAESCRIFQSIGIQERLEVEDAQPANRHIFVNEEREPLLELYFDGVAYEHGYPLAMRFHQPALERMLREDFEIDDKIDAFYGFDVLEVDGEAGMLKVKNIDTGEETNFTGQYIIGADGGGSLCRKYVGAERIDFGYSRQWIVIDIVVHDSNVWNGLINRSEFKCRPDGAVVFVKGMHNHVRFDFEVTKEVAESFDEGDARNLISEYMDASSIEFQRMAPYHFYAGMPASWRKHKVLLAGDAAHLTSPFSGQGLNMGIRDAANLGFKLDMVLSGLVSDEFLDTYEAERWKNCEHVINGATVRGQMISASTRSAKLKRSLVFFLGRLSSKLALEMARRMSDMVPYFSGLIGTHELAGYPYVQPNVETPDGKNVRLDEVTGDGFVLMLLAAEQSETIQWFESTLKGRVIVVGQDLQDSSGELGDYFKEHEVSAVLVRPDRYVYDAGQKGSMLCQSVQDSLEEFAPESLTV